MKLRILLLSNYLPDKQWSMLRFAELMEAGLLERGHHVVKAGPATILGNSTGFRTRFGKWTGYLDKFVLFPVKLRSMSWGFDVVHICDHSNTVYRSWIRSRASVATCHDLLAVRAALGEDTSCSASAMGRRLQASILKNLAAVSGVACDSTATMDDFIRLTGRVPDASLRTIFLGFSSAFAGSNTADSAFELQSLGLGRQPYMLHVGSSQPRKNREGVLRVAATLVARGWEGLVVFAGESLSAGQVALAQTLGILERTRQLADLSDRQLATVYAGSRVTLFPSYSEGFGWPVLEAQACGSPVICSNKTSLPEVVGGSALVFDPDDITRMADAVVRLEDEELRQQVIGAGFRNVARFSIDRMIDDYLDLYRHTLQNGHMQSR